MRPPKKGCQGGEIFVALLDRDPCPESGRDPDPPGGGAAPQNRTTPTTT